MHRALPLEKNMLLRPVKLLRQMNIQSNLYKVVLYMLLVMACSLSCKTENSQKFDLATEKEKLMKRVDEFNTAFGTGEIEKLEAMITNNYVHTNGSSKSIPKNDWLAYLKKRKKELLSGRLVVKNYKMNETKVEISNNIAILTAKVSFTTITSYEQKENEFRVTNIWVKKDGIWKRAGFHDTRIK